MISTSMSISSRCRCNARVYFKLMEETFDVIKDVDKFVTKTSLLTSLITSNVSGASKIGCARIRGGSNVRHGSIQGRRFRQKNCICQWECLKVNHQNRNSSRVNIQVFTSQPDTPFCESTHHTDSGFGRMRVSGSALEGRAVRIWLWGNCRIEG